MTYEFSLPDVGEGITESELLKWHVKPGDVVREDEVLCEIETDKAVVEIPVPCNGTVQSLHAAEGSTVKVGSVIAVFATEAVAKAAQGANGAVAKAAASAAVAAPAAVSPAPTFQAVSQAALAPPVHATPSTRRYAREQGVALESVIGSGPQGRILHEDIDRHVVRQAQMAAATGMETATTKTPDTSSMRLDVRPVAVPAAGQQRRTPLKGMRRAIADTMVRSVTVIPHATSGFRCNAEAFVALRQRLQEYHGCRISFTAMVIKAMIPALKKYPYFNASIDDMAGEIVEHGDINIGFATHTGEGLMVPVIKHADQKSLVDISTEIDRLAALARERKIALADLRGGTITLSNVGSHGKHDLIGRPIINHPEAAIIAMTRIKPQPAVENGQVVVQQTLDMVTSYDHRLIDGVYAAEFMEAVIALIEEPGLMLGV
ncbi:MAG: pyruvate dehydrogenase E2 component (dihydrolipoamide acetyltransferase) [Rugosibacter sp.]|jgi:pyruvate dehydrogenase E2 component (dihydrolipoamide acetyltransferase)|nr:pyruvate dehydrogenase E2 component (dihydrolipoamide acetyltransferase) [Rugosibacter sp.]